MKINLEKYLESATELKRIKDSLITEELEVIEDVKDTKQNSNLLLAIYEIAKKEYIEKYGRRV